MLITQVQRTEVHIHVVVTFMETKARRFISTVIQLEVHIQPLAQFAKQVVSIQNYEVE